MLWKIYFEYFNTDGDQTGDSFYNGDFPEEDWDGNGADGDIESESNLDFDWDDIDTLNKMAEEFTE